MNNIRRLLILSCSQRKHTSHEPLPAIERYNGPLFYVLRRFLRECPRQIDLMNVHILSAANGLIPGNFPTPWYDRKMDISRAVELRPQVNAAFSDILRDNYTSVCFVLGKTYLKAFESALKLVPPHTESTVTHGRIGEKQARLKKWLWGENPHTRAARSPNEIRSY